MAKSPCQAMGVGEMGGRRAGGTFPRSTRWRGKVDVVWSHTEQEELGLLGGEFLLTELRRGRVFQTSEDRKTWREGI